MIHDLILIYTKIVYNTVVDALMSSRTLEPSKIQQMKDLIQNPMVAYQQIQQVENKPVIGYFTDLVPFEIISAVGAHPTRILSNANSDEPLDSMVQTYCCSYMRNFLSQSQAINLKETLSGIIFTDNFCDSLQSMADIFQHVFPDIPTLILPQPVSKSSPNSEKYYHATLNELFNNLKEITKEKPDQQSLQEQINYYQNIREMQTDLESIYYSKHEDIKFSDFFTCILAKEVLSREKYQKFLNKIIESWKTLPTNESSSKARIIVVGGMFSDVDVFDVIEDGESSIVGELLLNGRRDYMMRISSLDSPMKSLSQAYLTKIPSSTRYDLSLKNNELLKLIKDRKANGVIHLNWKFCDPDAFEAVIIKKVLEKENIPFLMLETDPQQSNLEQLKTRSQAFIEMLEAS